MLIQGGEKDVTDVPKNWALKVKRPSTGRAILGDRSTVYRAFRRPVEHIDDRSTKLYFRPLATNSSSLQVPPMTKFSWSNPDSKFNQDASYASTFMANGSFCEAYSLNKLGLRPSYAKDTKKNYSILTSYPRKIFVDSSNHNADFEIIYDFGGCIDILVTCRFIVQI